MIENIKIALELDLNVHVIGGRMDTAMLPGTGIDILPGLAEKERAKLYEEVLKHNEFTAQLRPEVISNGSLTI